MKENKINKRRIQELGISEEELNELIQAKILCNEGEFYAYNNVKDIYYFAKDLYQHKKFELADKCLLLCYSLNPFFYRATSTLFTKAVGSEKISEAAAFLRKLMMDKDNPRISMHNTYLYVISYMIPLSEYDRENAKRFNVDDLLVRKTEFPHEALSEQNLIKKAIYNQKFSYAQKLTKELRDNHPNLKNKYFTLSLLLQQAMSCQLDKRLELESFVKFDNIRGAIEFLKREESLHQLNTLDQHIYTALTDLEYLNTNGTLPKRDYESVKHPNVYNAIDMGDYNLAKAILDSYQSQPNYLLERIINKILEIQNTKQNETEKIITLK